MIFSPLPGTPLITHAFGQNPDMYVPFGLSGHNGIDFGVPEGTIIYAPHDGTATVKDEGAAGYGISVTIDDGKRRSVLAHLSKADVASGQFIYQGDPIGKSGKTGNASGPHLHWTYKILKSGIVQNKDNGYEGAVDVTEFTRLWLDQDLHHNAEVAETAAEYLTMSFTDAQYLKNPMRS